MNIAQTFEAENSSFLNHGCGWIGQRLSISVNVFFVLLLLFCTANTMVAQVPLSSMPKEKRDSALVEITQNLLKEKFPKWYREKIIPSVTQSDFKHLNRKWLQEGWPASFYILPEYLKPEDLCYDVTLYYENYYAEGFEWNFTAQATIIDKSHEVYRIFLGGNMGYRWHALQQMKAVEPLSSMSVEKRDSILVEISQNVLKEKYPELYREDIYPLISQSDFRLKDLEWTDEIVEYTPNYVAREDKFYIVTLYYEKWRKEKLQCPFTAIVYIVEKTREPYLIRLGSDYHFRNLLKPSETE